MQTVSLELSKKLAAAGLKIETFSIWAGNELKHNIKVYGGEGYYYPAPSTDELLAVIPPIRMSKVIPNFYNVRYSNGIIENFEEDKFLPEALGKMCLWLLENGYKYNQPKNLLEKEGR